MDRPGKPGLARSPLSWLSALLLAYLAVPLAVFIVRSGGHPGEGFSQPGLWGAFAISAEAATISATLIGFFGIPLAYLLARRHGRASSIAGVMVQLPLALPPLMSGVVLLYVFGPYTWLGDLSGGRFTESLTGIVLAQTFVASPFLVITARAAFRAVDPSLEDVAATAGLRPLHRFALVAVPLAAPGIRAGLLLAWLRAFGEYGATVMLSYHPYSLPVFLYTQFSAIGLPATQAPALLALGLAAVVVGLSRVRLPKRRRKVVAAVAPALASGPRPPVPVGFDLSMDLGAFRLRLAHQASSHRLAIVGPSGAGKSLTLRSLAGLMPGTVSFGGRPVGSLPPEERRVGYVPQGQSLMPNLSAWENIVFGRHADPAVASWWSQALGLEGLEELLPADLSGGQRQRVALARAFSCQPSVVLLDEPFTGLDAPARTALLQELRRLQLQAGLSSVLVTHDYREAALLADEIVVISAGCALQAGPLAEVSRHPASPEVAALLGFRNLLPGVSTSPVSLRAGTTLVTTGPHGVPVGGPLTWCVRPEQVLVGGAATPGNDPAKVTDVVELGASYLVTLSLGEGLVLEADLAGGPGPPKPGEMCSVSFPPGAILAWPAASGH